MKIRGEVLIADEINSNGIIYPKEAIEKACLDLQNNEFPILSDFPESSDLLSSDLICGKITKAEIENNNLVINADIDDLGENKVQLYCCAVGIGELDENCTLITLEVASKNIAAINLYEKFGFEIVNVRKNYYPDGDDAYLMARSSE